MAKKTVSDVSFEKLYTELETTIEQLEAGNLTLDEALALYERGITLANECGALLDRAELKIQELSPAPMQADDDDVDDASELFDADDDA